MAIQHYQLDQLTRKARTLAGGGPRLMPSGRPVSVADLLGRVAGAGSILEAIRLTPLVSATAVSAASRSSADARIMADQLVAVALDPADAVTGIAAVQILGTIPGREADRALAGILQMDGGPLAAHAARATVRRSPSGVMLMPLVELVAVGGLAGMHAQATLSSWAATDPWLVAAALRSGLESMDRVEGRRHLAETLGLIPDRSVTADLISLATDGTEADPVRVAAIAALGDRRGVPLPRAVAALAQVGGGIGDAARLALLDRASSEPRAGSGQPGAMVLSEGVGVAQVHLGATLDPDLVRSGMGDTGGVATLLVTLGAALGRTPGISKVVTIGRGTSRDVLEGGHPSVAGQMFGAVPLAPEDGASFADPWPARLAAERGIRRVFRQHGRPDLVHLRMADVGTLAAANVAGAMGIPVVFSLAPDPHALIAGREQSGELDRRTFAAADAEAHLWYRVNLVDRLARDADHVVLFPRAELAEQLQSLFGFEVTAQTGRFTVVPEGIDVARVRHSVAARAPARALDGLEPAPPSAAVADLLSRLEQLPTARRGLPIVLSVGRLNELKGMARLVEAFALDRDLLSRATLVIVGGDLEDPTPAESAELARIERAMAAKPDLASSVILLGHRPNADVADLLGAVRYGVPSLIGQGGAYACASRKEEFGLAIVEALAAGLPVVAPLAGGPATYVEDGRTGMLVDTSDPPSLARGITAALDLSSHPGRARHAAEAMAQRYDISSMASSLAGIYGRLALLRRSRLAS